MSFAYALRGTVPDMHIFMKPTSGTGNAPRTQSYDISTTEWTARTAGSVTLDRGVNVAGIGPFCICTAGSYFDTVPNPDEYTVQTATQQFEADAGAWTTLRVNPSPRDGAVCPVVRSSSFLLVGGTAGGFAPTGDRGSTTVQEWMLNTFTTHTSTTITGKRTEAGYGQSTVSGALSAQYGFIAGGYARTSSVDSFLTSCYEFNINGLTWSSALAVMPSGRFAGGCFTIDNETYFVGGGVSLPDADASRASTEADNTDDVLSWNRTTNVWTTRTDIPGSKRRSIGCGAILGKGYAVGGSADGSASPTNYGYNMRYTPFTDSWESDLTTYNTPANIVMRGCIA